jgi:hypothetical protein
MIPLLTAGDAVGILVALAVWLLLVFWIGVAVGRRITRRNRRR